MRAAIAERPYQQPRTDHSGMQLASSAAKLAQTLISAVKDGSAYCMEFCAEE